MSNTSNGIVAVYANGAAALREPSSLSVKVGLAQMLRGGVIMNVVDAEQARLAEEAGSCAVMTVEPGGGVARMPDPTLLKDIKRAVTVTVPVMAKVRIGHFVEAQILEAVGVDYVDESEVLAPADHQHHINKHSFRVPFVCGAKVERFASRKFVISPAVAVAVWNLLPSIHKVGFGLGTPV